MLFLILCFSYDQKSTNIYFHNNQKGRMTRISTVLLILAALLMVSIKSQSNGTESYFISPHGLAKSPEVGLALDKIAGQIRVKRTTYNHSTITYTLDNVTIGMAYIDAKQTAEIPQTDLVKVTGGRIEFTYRFNYTKVENRNTITGYGYGSVLSDPLTYYKELNYCGSFLCWRLQPKFKMENLTLIQNRMKIKRLEPFNETDLQNMQDMLDKVFSSIDPANFQVQILQIFNQIFPLALDDSLNHQILGENVNYTYYSNTHGQMKMNIIHQVHGFGIKPVQGYRTIFVTKIQNYPEPVCNTTVPLTPYEFTLYGSSQMFHQNCIYQAVVFYLHSNGWLDTVLDDNWESNSFQFYAGDLFDLIGNLYLAFSPRAILDGSCIAQKQGLRFFSSREFQSNSYTLDVTYNCSLKGTNKDGSTVQILKFRSMNKIYIKAEATKKTLSFKIILADILNMSFEPVGQYFVNNINLAMFKARSVMKNIINTYTFGTGFPTITRDLPRTTVEQDYVLYHDASHYDSVKLLDS